MSKFRHEQVAESGFELHPASQQPKAYLGMPKGRVGRQGPGRDAGCTGSLVEGWEHPLR